MDLVLGIDSSTTATKAIAWDTSTTTTAASRRVYRPPKKSAVPHSRLESRARAAAMAGKARRLVRARRGQVDADLARTLVR